MKLAKLIWVIVSTVAFSQQRVERVHLSESKQMITGFSGVGEISLNATRMLIDIHFPNGKSGRGDLTVIRDPTSGYFLWRYAQHSDSDRSSSFIDDFRLKAGALWVESDGIVEFHMPSSIYVKKHTGRASTLDAAVQASIEEIRHGLATFESNGFSNNALKLKIQELDSDFACMPDNSFCGGGKSKIITLSKDGDKWKLVLRNRYDVELVFNSTFHWVSTRNLSDQIRTKSKMLPIVIAPNSAK